MAYFAGVDISSYAVDIVLLDEETNDAAWRKIRLDTGPGDAFARARRVRDQMPARGAWADRVLAAAIEKPYSRSWVAGSTLMRVQGAVLACLPSDLTMVELAPVEWKQVCGLRANATKDDVGALVRGLWTNQPGRLDDNACDAYAIAWAYRQLCIRHSETTAA